MKLSKVMQLGVLAAGLVSTQSLAVTVYGPSSHAGTYVKSTTYYFCSSSSGSHTALDICVDTSLAKATCNGCNATNVLTMLSGTYTYKYFGGCAADCDSVSGTCNGGAGNYFVVTGSNGYEFRQLHLNASSASVTKTAGRGTALGLLGSTGASTAPHVHADNRKSGTRLSAWYSGYVTCGSSATSSHIVGNATLQ